MKKYLNKIICGDCIAEMKKLPKNSIDTIITDPPYGLEFMGKEWDRLGDVGEGRSKKPTPAESGQPFNKRIGRVSYNVTQNVRCKKCGHWKFSGTPCKCKNPNFPNLKAIQAQAMQDWHLNWAKEALRVAKPGATLLCFGGTRTYHRMACAIEDAGWILKDCIMWLYGSGFPKATDISKQLDKRAGKKGKIVGKEKIDKGIQKGSMHAGRKSEVIERDITEPATPEAKLWNGWKSHGLKPAYEPIIVAMKPNEGSYANNALKHGVAGLNIDGGRIGCDWKSERPDSWFNSGKAKKGKTSYQGHLKSLTDSTVGERLNTKGRFPANLILDEEAAKMLDGQSGDRSSTRINNPTNGNKGGMMFGNQSLHKPGKSSDFRDTGGASRFFYIAKASKAERNMGCEGLEEKYWHTHINANNPLGIQGTIEGYSKNNHPTVKPLKLMEYLCILTKTPTGGIVLDPFAGSGTTGIACKNTNRDYILIEKEKEYCEIAEARIKAMPDKLL